MLTVICTEYQINVDSGPLLNIGTEHTKYPCSRHRLPPQHAISHYVSCRIHSNRTQWSANDFFMLNLCAHLM